MQRFQLQLFFLLSVIALTLASSALPDGCVTGESYAFGCVECVCPEGKPMCYKTTSCETRNYPPKNFFTYPYIPVPPRAPNYHPYEEKEQSNN